MNAAVFLGPTISAEEASAHIDAMFLPPVSQGDIFACIETRPRAIGIIDGYFQNVPSVWHKEILWAMAEGIYVFGASSMGALRAAELHSFGMIGVGQIFEAYRDGTYTRDDEVAIIHAPAEMNFMQLSEPMANIRVTFAKAFADGIIDQVGHDSLIMVAEADYFPDRRYGTVIEKARLSDIAKDRLREWLKDNSVNQKRRDAIEMLSTMNAFLKRNPEPMTVAYPVENTFVFDGGVRPK